MKYYWKDGKWQEDIIEITEETKTQYVTHIPGGISIDVTHVVKNYFGGDIEAFKKNLKSIEISSY